MNADQNLSEGQKSIEFRFELLDEEGMQLIPFDEVKEETNRKKERWHIFKTP